jgi:uroporphyrin-3 C-methyltransferase
MATHNDAKTTLSQPVMPTKSPSTRRGLYSYAIITTIALIAIGSAIYSIKIDVQLRQGTAEQVQLLISQMATLQQQQIDEKTQVDTSFTAINDSQDKLQNKLNTLNKHLQSALQQRLYQTKDWLLLKARYYLELAQVNAHWSDNWQTTTALLQQADTLLADIHDQQLFKIRQAIAKELTQLQTMPKIDIPGLLSQLDATTSMITNLPLKPTVPPENKKIVTTSNNKTLSTWRERLRESVGLLEELVVIRHHDEYIAPLPSPAYESMLRESIRLYFQEAQWAVLQNNEAVYQLSLAQAIKKINLSFDSEATETVALLEQLQTLQHIHLLEQKPILEQSLPLLNKLIESKDTQAPADAGEKS